MSIKPIFYFLAALFLFSAVPAHSQMQGNRKEPQLPDGDGKADVQQDCSLCHSLGNITNSGGHTPEDWKTTFSMMLNVGAPVPKDRVPVVLDYLIKSFPEQPKPPAVVIPGDVAVSFQEWKLPTPGERDHDPLAGQDGSIWYSGQMANVIGHLDPTTGNIKEYPLPPHSGPHGLIMDKDGNVWFTANFGAYIGKLDPKTGKVTQYTIDPRDRDPHTPIFDGKGDIIFTVQGADMVGKLDMATGETKSVPVPTPKANPYGMVRTSKGLMYFVEFGANKIASIDPATLAIQEYLLPDEASRPRRVAVTPDDVLYYSDYSRGYLGEFDTKTNKFVTEWPSPGGEKSKPYGITFADGAIWYSESGVKPNTLVRFDTQTQKFQTWVIPAGGGVVRNMMHTSDGKLILTESGENVVALVTVKNETRTAMETK
jgi:virginiamycin B lyase